MIDLSKDWGVLSAMAAAAMAMGGNLYLLRTTRAKADAAEKELRAALYEKNGITIFTPREMCRECRRDCDARRDKEIDVICKMLKELGEKIDQRNKDDQAYREDMMKKVYQASGMLSNKGSTVNQVGSFDIEALADAVAKRIKP